MKKKEIELYKKFSPKLAEVLKTENNEKFWDSYFSKIMTGSEIINLDESSFEEWLKQRLIPNLIFLDLEDYTECAIEALETYKDIAPTDFGRSRQRDEVQLWADKIRGYLAEKAFQKKLLLDFKIESKTPHESGNLKKYLDSDIPLIKKNEEKEFRKAKLKTSIKMTKWNGVWLDIAGAQYKHSDVFVQIKVNTGTEHLMSFLKHRNFFTELLKEKHNLNNKKDIILSKVKDFKKISLFAYIAGFRKIDNLEFKYEGKKPKTRLNIISAEGLLTKGELKRLATEHGLRDKKGEIDIKKISFAGINEFSSFPRFITNTGKLKYKKEDWQNFIGQI